MNKNIKKIILFAGISLQAISVMPMNAHGKGFQGYGWTQQISPTLKTKKVATDAVIHAGDAQDSAGTAQVVADQATKVAATLPTLDAQKLAAVASVHAAHAQAVADDAVGHAADTIKVAQTVALPSDVANAIAFIRQYNATSHPKGIKDPKYTQYKTAAMTVKTYAVNNIEEAKSLLFDVLPVNTAEKQHAQQHIDTALQLLGVTPKAPEVATPLVSALGQTASAGDVMTARQPRLIGGQGGVYHGARSASAPVTRTNVY